MSERQAIRIAEFRKKKSRLTDEYVTLAHGAGGKASATLVDDVFIRAFANETLSGLEDAGRIPLPSGETLAISTDSFVVQPLQFPGGSIGHLAVHGSINDVACLGANPTHLAAACIIEEGFSVMRLREIVADMATAAANAGVTIVTGDTKVVGRGAADGMFIATSAVGVIPQERCVGAKYVRPGDKILVSGNLGDHGVAVMLARGDLGVSADVVSDTAPIHHAIAALYAAGITPKWFRDPTRGGLGTVCNELAQASGLTVLLEETAIPVQQTVRAVCELLGIDPIYVASEGQFIAVVSPDQADQALATLHECGQENACIIGKIGEESTSMVQLATAFGGQRMVDMLVGDPLPRIC